MCKKADLSSARAKLNWANTQINILDAEIRAFIDRKPYSVREKPKPKLQREGNIAQRELFEKGRFFEIILTEEIPDGIKASAGMTVQAIRDSLDHLAHALAKKNGSTKTTDVYFVIADSEAEFLGSRAQRKLRRISGPDRQIIAALKPYKGGNDLLYALHWLNNKSKHREMIAVATGVDPSKTKMRGGPGQVRKMLFLPRGNTFCPDEPIICIDADKDIEFSLTATVAFREIVQTPGQSVVGTLHEFSRLANSIIDLFS
jgi:hypothetical protein